VSDVFKKHQRRIAREDARIPDAILGVLYPNARSKNEQCHACLHDMGEPTDGCERDSCGECHVPHTCEPC